MNGRAASKQPDITLSHHIYWYTNPCRGKTFVSTSGHLYDYENVCTFWYMLGHTKTKQPTRHDVTKEKATAVSYQTNRQQSIKPTAITSGEGLVCRDHLHRFLPRSWKQTQVHVRYVYFQHKAIAILAANACLDRRMARACAKGAVRRQSKEKRTYFFGYPPQLLHHQASLKKGMSSCISSPAIALSAPK